MCYQQSLRSACACAQSDQSLCSSFEYSMSVKLLSEHHWEFLSFKGVCTCSSEYTLVKMSHCWKSHATVLNLIISWKIRCRKALCIITLRSLSTLSVIPSLHAGKLFIICVINVIFFCVQGYMYHPRVFAKVINR